MTPKQIQRKYRSILKRETNLYEQLKELRSLCEHPEAIGRYKGSTGNWDPSCDCYWIEWECPDCGKSWNTEQ